MSAIQLTTNEMSARPQDASNGQLPKSQLIKKSTYQKANLPKGQLTKKST
jgi:hypothetical protein